MQIRSVTPFKCGEVNIPVRRSWPRTSRSIMRVVEVLPLVPVTWTERKARCGSPIMSSSALMRSRVKSQRENPRASSAASTCASSAFNVVVSPFLALPLRGGRLSGPAAPGVLLSSEAFELRGDARDVGLGGGLAGADLLDHGLGGLGEERLVAELPRRAV